MFAYIQKLDNAYMPNPMLIRQHLSPLRLVLQILHFQHIIQKVSLEMEQSMDREFKGAVFPYFGLYMIVSMSVRKMLRFHF